MDFYGQLVQRQENRLKGESNDKTVKGRFEFNCSYCSLGS
jgi:hypothetical protein